MSVRVRLRACSESPTIAVDASLALRTGNPSEADGRHRAWLAMPSISYLPPISRSTSLVRTVSRQRRPSSCRETAHVTVRNPRQRGEPGKRLLLIGHTDGGRLLTLVLERTVDPTTWLIVTGWASTEAERRILEARP